MVSNIHNLRAIAFTQVDDKVRAQADFQRAHDVLEDAYGPYHPTLAQSRNNLGAVCIELGDLDCARSTLEKSLQSLDAASNPNRSSKGRVLALLSNVAFWQDRLDDAEHHARASLDTADDGPSVDPAAVLNAHQGLLRALVHAEKWDAGTADVAVLLAWSEKHLAGTARSADARILAADFHRHRGNNDQALPLVRRAREIREEHLKSPRDELADAWRLEAGILRDLARLEEAEAALNQAEKIIGQLDDAPQLTVARIQLSRVRQLTETNELPRARALSLALLQSFDDPQPLAAELRQELGDWMREHDVPLPADPSALAPLNPG